jgi:phosphatidylglycerol:prolipoprotein diacylglycerol transferase
VIPHVEIPSIKLFGPIELHPFGLLVATGIMMGSWFAQRRAQQQKIDLVDIRGAVVWAVVVGFVGAHLVSIVYYFPDRVADEGFLVLLKIWDGISSVGGFVGALIGLHIYFGRESRPFPVQLAVCATPFVAAWVTAVNVTAGQTLLLVSFALLLVYYHRGDRPWMRHADVIVQALVLGWVFGRLGCTVAFDHPGQVSHFFLAEEYKDGLPRHNLGFYEFLYTLVVMLPAILWLFRRRPKPGVISATALILYCPIRFVLDFLRSTDREGSDLRYLGLTPAQYATIGLLILGVWLLIRAWRGDFDKPLESPSGQSNRRPARRNGGPTSGGSRKRSRKKGRR